MNIEKKDELIGALEALLFSVGDKVSLSALSQALDTEPDVIEKVLNEMMLSYERCDHGVQIVKLEDAYQMCTKPAYYEQLTKLVHIPKKHVLTDVLLETLSIVAYKQPITRQEIEAIRGVSSMHAVNKLVEYHLVEEVGRMDTIGHPILFGTTDDFLRCFGVSSPDELPSVSPDKIEDFKKEAMKEASMALDI